MNLLLIKPEELQDENRAVIRGDTLARLRNSQHELDKGRQLKAGIRNGLMGTAEITESKRQGQSETAGQQKIPENGNHEKRAQHRSFQHWHQRSRLSTRLGFWNTKHQIVYNNV